MYEFASWSDGGAAIHAVETPATNATYTATYRKVASPPPPPPPGGGEAVLWTQLVNVTAEGSSLRKTGGCDGCENAGAVSSQTITSGDGFVEFTASETTTIRVAGLSHGNTNTTSADIDFGVKLWPGGVADVRENDLYRADTTYGSGDVFRVAVQSGVIRYSKNGVVFYTSSVAPTFPLLVDTSLYSLNATIGNAVIFRSTAPDTTRPSVSITSPVNGDTVSDTTPVMANASDNVGVTQVQFFRDGTTSLGVDATNHYSVSWDTTTASNGVHTLTAVASDAAGNSRTSASVLVAVSNDTTPPPPSP
jgi:hypothetical protein